jgi:hypothetical protein
MGLTAGGTVMAWTALPKDHPSLAQTYTLASSPAKSRRLRLQPGKPAPNFTLLSLDEKSLVRLSMLRGRPVVLIFGSYT